MAITKILHQKASPDRELGIHTKQLIDYIMNPDKTEDCLLVGGVNCIPKMAYEQMKKTKELFGKTGGRQSYHIIISLKPGEGKPDQLYEMTEQFIEELLGREYEAVYAVHTDHEHLHSHIVFNSVNMITGKKYQHKNGDWKYKIQPITNRLCEKYGYEIMPAEYSQDPKNVSRPDWEKEQSFSERIKDDVRLCFGGAESREHFIYLLKELGYEVKEGKHLAVKALGMKRFKRLDTLEKNIDMGNDEKYNGVKVRDSKADNSQSYDLKQYDAESYTPKLYILNPATYKRPNLSPLQKKYYARMYRIGLLERRKFYYRSATYYQDLRKFHRLQAEYLFLEEYNIKSSEELLVMRDRLVQRKEEITKEQQKLYREKKKYQHNQQKELPEIERITVSNNLIFIEKENKTVDCEAGYRQKLEKLKVEKKEIVKTIKIIDGIFVTIHSLYLSNDIDKIPVKEDAEEQSYLDNVKQEEIPDNPYRTKKDKVDSPIAMGQETTKINVQESSEIEIKHESHTKSENILNEMPQIDNTVGYNEDKSEQNQDIDYDVLLIGISAVEEIVGLGLKVEEYLALPIKLRSSVFDFSEYDFYQGMEAYKEIIKTAGRKIGHVELYEEYYKLYEKCKELRGDTYERNLDRYLIKDQLEHKWDIEEQELEYVEQQGEYRR